MLNADEPMIQRARALRSAMSLPEVLLWRELRRTPHGLKFRRQHPAVDAIAHPAAKADRVARTAATTPPRPYGAPSLAGEDDVPEPIGGSCRK